jgi:hypothetical protein
MAAGSESAEPSDHAADTAGWGHPELPGDPRSSRLVAVAPEGPKGFAR